MKLKYSLALALCLIGSTIRAEDYYAPWTKSTIANNTKYPIKVSLYYSIPGCKLTTMTGMPCPGPRSGDCDYRGCRANSALQYTLKPFKTTNIFNPPNDVLDVGVTMPEAPGNDGDALIIELNNNPNVKPVTIKNLIQKQYIVTFDGKTLSVK